MRYAGTWWRNDEGQDLVEYGLIALLISTAAIFAISAFGTQAAVLWARIAAGIPR